MDHRIYSVLLEALWVQEQAKNNKKKKKAGASIPLALAHGVLCDLRTFSEVLYFSIIWNIDWGCFVWNEFPQSIPSHLPCSLANLIYHP